MDGKDWHGHVQVRIFVVDDFFGGVRKNDFRVTQKLDFYVAVEMNQM